MRARALRPGSLRGQILAAVLAALVVAQLAAGAIALLAGREALRGAQIGDALERIAALVVVLEQSPAAVQGELLRLAETPLTRLAVEARPALAASGPGMARATRRLASALGAETEGGRRDLRLALALGGAPAGAAPPPRMPRREGGEAARPGRRLPPGGLDARRLTVAVPLAGGDWLNAEVRFARPERAVSATSVAGFLLAALAVAGALMLTLGRLLGPLRGLAAAAERLGRGEAVGALPVRGPSEMQALTEAFNRMQERLHRMLSDRTQMLAALGHDLRSPLTALRLRAEMVDEDETREAMLGSLAEMQGMVEQTLTYARGVWTAEPVETVEAGAFLAGFAAEAGATAVLPPGEVPLRLRPATLRRALRNLTDNARRYGGGEVELALVPGPETVAIEVRDRGPGIPEAELARVFDPFVRLEASRSRETGGTGLGLSIARSIAQAHGGDVRLANRAGGGLVATVLLPRPAAA